METQDPIEFRMYPSVQWSLDIWAMNSLFGAVACAAIDDGQLRILFGGFCLLVFVVCVAAAVAVQRWRLRIGEGGIQQTGVFAGVLHPWEDITKITLSTNERLGLSRFLILDRRLGYFSCSCGTASTAGGLERVEALIANLPAETRPALEMAHIPVADLIATFITDLPLLWM